MIILIQKSEIFLIDPDTRFSSEYNVDRGLWKEMWRRYKLLEYTHEELCLYFELKTRRQISRQNVKRWILRTEIYSKIKPAIDKGCESVQSNYFGELEWLVIKEVTKNLKSSVKKNSKILV